jgi:hypothetical protein
VDLQIRQERLIMRKTTNTRYCENCMCYVPEDVDCADSECPLEGSHMLTGEDVLPIDFTPDEGREYEPEHWAELQDEEDNGSLLREIYRSRDEEDPCNGC